MRPILTYIVTFSIAFVAMFFNNINKQETVMRRTPFFDKSKNEYITKLEKLYLVSPTIYYAFMNLMIKSDYPVGYMDFSNKTECIKLPEHEKIYPATIFHSYYEVFILSNQKELLDSRVLEKHLRFITSENHFPQIMLIATNDKNKQKILSMLDHILPKKTDDLNYNLAVITNAEFTKAYDDIKDVAIKDTICKMNALIG